MFQFIGYNFFSDQNALNIAPSLVDNITSVRLTNAIYDHLNITRNVTEEITTDIPTTWDFDTILNASFSGNLNAGNVDFLLEEISAIKIKRRIQGEFDWITLKIIPINTIEDLNFVFDDFLNQYGVTYEYAFVPIMGNLNNPVEGNYIINNILSKFNGVFIGNATQIYKLLYGVQYDSTVRNQQIGLFQVLGQQYPIFIANSNINYDSGSVTATILNDEFETNGQIDRVKITEHKNKLLNFLNNQQPKILKDWNGNIWLCIINNNINIAYANNFGMGIPTIQFEWTEIGNAKNGQDLFNNGLISEVT